jgi:IS605 OrfB family transposase
LTVPEYCKNRIHDIVQNNNYRRNKTRTAYSIRVSRTINGYETLVTFDIPEISTTKWNKRNIAGIDLNPEGIACTIVSPNGNLVKTRFFKEPALATASTNKRKNILGELVKKVTNRAKKTYSCNLIVLELLKFKRAYDSNANNNRILSNFAKEKMIQTFKAKAIKECMIIAEVDPKYSSKIALEKYAKQLQAFQRHELATFIIARRALGYSEQPTLNYFENHLMQIC